MLHRFSMIYIETRALKKHGFHRENMKKSFGCSYLLHPNYNISMCKKYDNLMIIIFYKYIFRNL